MRKQLHFLIFLIFILSCKKEHNNAAYNPLSENKGLTFEEDSLIASLPSKIFNLSEVVFSNGQTVEQYLRRHYPLLLNKRSSDPSLQQQSNEAQQEVDPYQGFISRLTFEGVRLVNNQLPDWTFPQGEEAETQPAQQGLAYVFNQDNSLDKRKKAGACNRYLYGLDCSAMTWVMLKKAGVNFSSDLESGSLSDTSILNRQLRASSALKNFHYEEMNSSFDLDKLKDGDIVYFMRDDGTVFHIGVILVSAIESKPYIYQSNGTDTRSTYKIDKKTGQPETDKNGALIPIYKGCEYYDAKYNRGPRAVSIKDFVKLRQERTVDGKREYYFPFHNYGVLQLVPPQKTASIAKLSGDNQLGVINEYLAKPIVVQVKDEEGNLLSDIDVTFTVKSGGGVVDQSAVKTVNGLAQTNWKAGSLIGQQTVEVSAVDEQGSPLSGSPLLFVATITQFGVYLYNSHWVSLGAGQSELRYSIKIKKEYVNMAASFWCDLIINGTSYKSSIGTLYTNYLVNPVSSDDTFNYYDNIPAISGDLYRGATLKYRVYIPNVVSSNEFTTIWP